MTKFERIGVGLLNNIGVFLIIGLLFISFSSCDRCYKEEDLNGTWNVDPNEKEYHNYLIISENVIKYYSFKDSIFPFVSPDIHPFRIKGCDTFQIWKMEKYDYFGRVIGVGKDTLKFAKPSIKEGEWYIESWTKVEDFEPNKLLKKRLFD